MSGIVALSISACAPPLPEPTPSTTVSGFASEEEAFRAAEATYRAYIDALNDVDLADPATFEPVYAWLIGDALAGSKESFSRMHAEKLSVSGDSSVPRVEPRVAGREEVVVDACLDVSDVKLVNASGQSVVSQTREDQQPRRVTFSPGGTPTGLTITRSEPVRSAVCG